MSVRTPLKHCGNPKKEKNASFQKETKRFPKQVCDQQPKPKREREADHFLPLKREPKKGLPPFSNLGTSFKGGTDDQFRATSARGVAVQFPAEANQEAEKPNHNKRVNV